MNSLNLFFDGINVGAIKGPFKSDGTWHGTFEMGIAPGDSESLARVRSYIVFVIDWNERIRSGKEAKASDFDCFSDVVKSQKWSIVNADMRPQPIIDAPVFFRGDEISWRTEY